MQHVTVHVTSRTGSGLFERPDGQYGEVWYQLGARRAMSRSSTEPIVLETIYALAGIAPPTADDAPAYSGYPLARQPDGVPVVFYVVWPLLVLGAAWVLRRRIAGASR
jgi:MYXO-CTERM domain-containing protein